MLNIVLLEPELPLNTGNIGRTCAATGTRLHLIEPLGFHLSDKWVKRAGLDYWDKVDLEVYVDLEDFSESGTVWGRFPRSETGDRSPPLVCHHEGAPRLHGRAVRSRRLYHVRQGKCGHPGGDPEAA